MAQDARVTVTATDLRAMFVDVVARGELPNSKIVGYQWRKSGARLQCIIQNTITGANCIFEIDVATGKPYQLGSRSPQHYPLSLSRDSDL
jgi:hypothetical protein